MTDHDPNLHRFRSVVAHYRAGRPAYAALLIRRVAALCGVSKTSRVLDLGCGPGLLAAGMAPLAGEVVAMDPEPAMLAETERLGIANLRTVPGASADLGPHLGRFRLVTMGRSFHWMDRADTLRRLDALIEPGGAVALFRTDHPELPGNAWRVEFDALRHRYGGDDPGFRHRRGGSARHEEVLLDSAFSHIEVLAIVERRRVPVAALVDRGLSMSATSPERLGERTADFARDIAALMQPHLCNGMVEEIIESVAVLAFRPGEAPQHGA